MLIEIVSVPLWGIIRHHGLKVNIPGYEAFVYSNAPGVGVVRQSVAEFAGGRVVTSSPAVTQLNPIQVVARAERMLGRRYDVISWNCDHFVTSALGRKSESVQLRGVVAVLIGVFALSRMAA
jgi:hypothetical protein